MDPLADKLLIVAALVALVSLNRVEAWVAMVIITRELAVTVLRLGATQAGVVMDASMLGKLKTCVQIALILALIAVHGQPLWVSLLLYATVLVTVAVGTRLLLRPAPTPGARLRPRGCSDGSGGQPVIQRGVPRQGRAAAIS